MHEIELTLKPFSFFNKMNKIICLESKLQSTYVWFFRKEKAFLKTTSIL